MKRQMGMARLLLGVFGIGFLLLGVQFEISPAAVTSQTGLALPVPGAIQEVRTVYGGFFPGVGAYLLLSAFRQPMVRQGLIALAMIMGGLIVGRIVALAAEGPASTLFYALFASEIVGLALAAFLLLKRQL